MEDQLRLSLLIIGSIIIVAVFAHGIWKIRKNGQPAKRNRVEPQQWDESSSFADREAEDNHEQHFTSGFAQSDNEYQADSYDELGVGKVRVVGSDQPSSSQPSDANNSAGSEGKASDSTADTKESKQEEKLYGSVVTNPKPHMQVPVEPASADSESDDIPPPPGFLLKENTAPVNAPESSPVSYTHLTLPTILRV